MLLRRSALILPVLLLAMSQGACDPAGGAKEGVVPPSQRLAVAAVSYLDASGQSHTLAEHLGQVVVVDVWATWCPPCRKSLPDIAALQAQDGKDYVVLAISVDRNGWDDVRPYLGANPQLGLRASLPVDGSSLKPFGSIPAIPTTLIVDRQGRLRERWSGYYPGRVEKALQAALAES